MIDVKEPSRGALGRADPSVWRAVRAVVPPELPVSVALGELTEWPISLDFAGLSYRKLGLARAPADWVDAWAHLRAELGAGPPWVAVIYADWQRAASPSPTAVLDVALQVEDCAGVLFDTFDKSSPSPIDETWRPLFDRVRCSGRFSALAGRVDLSALARLSVLSPDLIAVRGAACVGGDRLAPIDPGRVAALASAVRGLATGSPRYETNPISLPATWPG